MSRYAGPQKLENLLSSNLIFKMKSNMENKQKASPYPFKKALNSLFRGQKERYIENQNKIQVTGLTDIFKMRT